MSSPFSCSTRHYSTDSGFGGGRSGSRPSSLSSGSPSSSSLWGEIYNQHSLIASFPSFSSSPSPGLLRPYETDSDDSKRFPGLVEPFPARKRLTTGGLNDSVVVVVTSPIASPHLTEADQDGKSVSTISMTETDDSTDSQATCYPLLTDADASMSSKESREELFGSESGNGDFPSQKSDVFYDVFKDYSVEIQKPERDVYVNENYRRKGLFDADKMYPCTKYNPCLLDRLIAAHHEEHVQGREGSRRPRLRYQVAAGQRNLLARF